MAKMPPSSGLRASATLLVVATLTLAPAAATAQTRTPTEVAMAREQFRLGIESVRQARWEQARAATGEAG